MPANIHNVSFFNPLDPAAGAALQVQQQQIQRQQAIAQALQQQAFQEDKVAPGSHVSWTQGLGKIAQALAAKSMYKKADAQQVDMATKQGQMMQRMFGLNQPGQTPSDNVSNTPAPQGNIAAIAAQLQPQAAAEAQVAPGGADDAVVPPPQPQQAPPPQQAPQQPQRGPMSLSGNAMQDYTDYSINPDEYTKALIASHAPDEFAKHLIQSGVAPDSPLFRQLMQGKTAKDNYVAPVNGRPGSTIRDPMDPSKVIGYDAPNIEGAVPEYGPDGMPTGYKQLPGSNAAMQNVSAAKAVGAAQGELVDVYDQATHQMVKVPKSTALAGGQGGAPMSAGPPLGATKAFDVTGTNSANAFQDISNGAADVPNRIYALHQMQTITNDPNSKFGAGSNGLNHFNSLLGTISQSAGIQFDPKAATNANEFQKWATQYSARSGQELGLSGSDARTQLAVHATPNGEMTRQALQSVVPQMIGIENAKQGYAQAANAWQHAHGPQSVQDFRTEWNKVYNPSIYTHMAQGPQAFVGWVKTLKPAEAAQVRQQYFQLKQLGALPQ